MATSSAREARRRKIMDRGSDRLALITGRIQSLPPAPNDSSPSTPPEDNPASTEADFDVGDVLTLITTVETCGDEATRSLGTQGTELRSPLLSSTGQSSVQLRSPLPSPTEQSSAPERAAVESPPREPVLWSPKQITSALAATEKTRLLCSVVFSVLVVLSCVGFPVLGGEPFRSVLGFGPLYLVLLTNTTLVLAQLLERQRSLGRADRGGSRIQPSGGNDLAELLGKTLEIGFLMKKLVDAVFMDCALYAVIVVCGLSVADKFR